MEPLKTITEWAQEVAALTSAREEEQRQRQIALDAAGVDIREFYKRKGFTDINFKSEPPNGIAILDSSNWKKYAIRSDDNKEFSLQIYDVSNKTNFKPLEQLHGISIEEVYANIHKYIES